MNNERITFHVATIFDKDGNVYIYQIIRISHVLAQMKQENLLQI